MIVSARQEKQFLFSLSRRWPPEESVAALAKKAKAKVAADRLGCHSSSGSWQLEAPKWRTASKMMSPPARAKVHDIGFVPELCSDRKAERKIHREKETERERGRGRALALSLWSEAHPTNVKSSW